MAREFNTGIDLKNQRAINGGNGTSPTDLVTLQQLLAYVNGLDWHQHVRVAAPANVNVSAPGATIDGVTMAVGDRVLLPNQTTASQGLIYLYQGASTAMILAADSVQGELNADTTVSVSEGTVNGGKSYTLTTPAPITVNTTALAWALNNSAVIYTALSNGGIILDGSNRFSVDRTKVAFIYATTVGDGATTSFSIVHNLGTADVRIQLYRIDTGAVIEADVSARTTTGFTLTFGTGAAPAASNVRVLVEG